MMTLTTGRAVRGNFNPILGAMMILTLLIGATPALRAADEAPTKAPYSVVYGDFGFGGFSPHATSATASAGFKTVPSIDFGLGVRPIRYLQAGMSLSILGNFSGAATQSAPFQCTSGCSGTETRNIVPRSLLFTSDARFVLPLFRDRLLVSAGGGIAWLQVSEAPQAVGNEQLQGCYTCQGRRGHGPTEVVELSYLPNQHVGFGLHVRNVQTGSGAFSSGANGDLRFLSIGGGVSLRFGTHH